MSNIPVKIKRIDPDLDFPLLTQATPGDAGFDLRSTEYHVVHPGENVLVSTGFAFEIPSDTFGAVCSRSGLALKNKVVVLNAPGIVDSGYRGEIKVILHNHGSEAFYVDRGDRIAQLVFQRYLTPDIEYVNVLSDTVRGEGGGGSTGIREVVPTGINATL